MLAGEALSVDRDPRIALFDILRFFPPDREAIVWNVESGTVYESLATAVIRRQTVNANGKPSFWHLEFPAPPVTYH